MSMALAKIFDCCTAKDKAKIKTRDDVLALLPEYEPGTSRTSQAFKDSCDVNKILKKHGINHVRRHYDEFAGEFGDFSDVPDLFEAKQRLDRGREIFDELSSEIRREFGNDMFAFYEWANDPENAMDVKQKLEHYQAPGDQLQVNRNQAQQLDLGKAVSGLVDAAAALEAASGGSPAPEGTGDSKPDQGATGDE